ncbi:hypothetical protein [Halomontanus rarus]|uniref:hypothetical protein n=1 Tax=Halomontanus rarus TaxID=3034020 RepID=UPI001A9937DA
MGLHEWPTFAIDLCVLCTLGLIYVTGLTVQTIVATGIRTGKTVGTRLQITRQEDTAIHR